MNRVNPVLLYVGNRLRERFPRAIIRMNYSRIDFWHWNVELEMAAERSGQRHHVKCEVAGVFPETFNELVDSAHPDELEMLAEKLADAVVWALYEVWGSGGYARPA